MRHWFLALAVLLSAAVGMSSADYILIKVNVGQTEEPAIPGPGAPGAPSPGGSGGARPGGSSPPPAGPSNNSRDFTNRRGGRGGRGGRSSAPSPGGSGASNQRSRPGADGLPGQPNGFGGLGQPGDEADAPIDVVAVVEVSAPYKTLVKVLRPGQQYPLTVRTPWGATRLWNLPAAPDVRVYPTSEEPSVAKRYAVEYAKVFPTNRSGPKPGAEQIQRLAEYALTHGLNDKFVEVMKKLAVDNPTNEAVVAFLKVQAALDRPVAQGPSAELTSHLNDYKVATLKDDKGHFVLYHKLSDNQQDEVQTHLMDLEEALRTYYYWFALKGVVLPVPPARLPALLTAGEREFNRTRDSLTDPPVVGDGFFARRERLAVFCAKPLDARYDMLDKYTEGQMTKYRLTRQDTLTLKEIPKGTSVYEAAYCGTLSLAMKELEVESQRAGASHNASRQLLFASGLLPRNVAVPEWILFGMGSFFETPEHAPWPTPTGLSPIYLPVFRNETGNNGKHFEGSPVKTLRKIVTDGYFRELTPNDYKNKTDRLLKARAATWSLTYFLAQRKLGDLQGYFKNLSEMPRDLELDDAALMDCFARAFHCYDPKTKKPDESKLSSLAEEWQGYMGSVNLESEDFLRTLQKIYAESNKVPPAGPPPGAPPPLGRPMLP